MRKKTVICTLALVMALLILLMGCGGGASPTDGSPETPTQASDAPTPTSEEPPTESEAPSAEPSEEPGPSEEPEEEAIHVGTAGEFLTAIAPGAVIELAPGVYNLTEYLRESSGDVSEYVMRGFNDGWQADISGVEGMTIRGAKDGTTEVVAEPRYADVLYFNACSDITIENITFGHTVEQGSCEGAVLSFDHCRDITLDGLDLYGCGTYGAEANHTVGIKVRNCIVRDCSYGIVDLRFCSDAVFENCTFKDNSGFDMLSFSASFALFDGCAFTGNEGSNFLPAYYYRGSESGARFERCSFGRWESQRLNEELKDCGSFVIGEECQFNVTPGKRIVHVSSMEQLIENIAPDTQLMIAPGKYNLSDTLSRLLEKEGGHFNESRSYVRIDEKYDGPELVITGVSGLTIASESGSAEDTEIVTEPRYADVLHFENCSGTGIMDITMGHTDIGECAGDVLYFDDCGDTVLRGLDLYGCGVYGIGTNECALLSCFDSTIRDCEYGALDLYGSEARQIFLNCVLTGSGSGGFFYADDSSNGEYYFYRCTFGEGESNSLVFNDFITAEECSWSDITEYPDYYEVWEEYEPEILDTSRFKAVSFDAQVLTDEEYYICYETVDRQSGDVSFEDGDNVRFFTFDEGGTGCFWTDDEKGRPFSYAMDSDYSCELSFNDGGSASLSLYADQGGALPDSEESRLWLAVYFDEETIWCY